MEVKPKIGFENIKFGMYRKDIIKILGEPDKIVTDENDKQEQRLDWNYLKIKLTFQADDRFTYFSCENPELKYNGRTFIGMEIERVKKEIFGDLISNWEIEDFETFYTHFEENFWLSLYSKYGTVTEFELGVPFKNETDYDWPE